MYWLHIASLLVLPLLCLKGLLAKAQWPPPPALEGWMDSRVGSEQGSISPQQSFPWGMRNPRDSPCFLLHLGQRLGPTPLLRYKTSA